MLDEMDRTGVVVKDHVVYNTLVTSLAKAEQARVPCVRVCLYSM